MSFLFLLGDETNLFLLDLEAIYIYLVTLPETSFFCSISSPKTASKQGGGSDGFSNPDFLSTKDRSITKPILSYTEGRVFDFIHICLVNSFKQEKGRMQGGPTSGKIDQWFETFFSWMPYSMKRLLTKVVCLLAQVPLSSIFCSACNKELDFQVVLPGTRKEVAHLS